VTGPRLAGRPWTLSEDRQLRDMLNAGKKAPEIAQKLKRTIVAVRARAQIINGRRKAAAQSPRPMETPWFYGIHKTVDYSKFALAQRGHFITKEFRTRNRGR
jgi:hypothetical protein